MSRYEPLVDRLLDVIVKSGDERYCRCPFHDDSNPSFAINVESGLWICHGCGEKGNANTLAIRLGGDDWRPESSLTEILERIKGLKETNEETIQPHLPEEWLKQFHARTEYWKSRGISWDMREEFDLGYDPLTRYATIGLRNFDGDLLGVIKRATLPRQKPKYIYPSGFHAARDMFGSWKVGYRHNTAVLVEGPLDAIACWEAGFVGLGLYGAKISQEQVSLLWRLGINTVIVATDNDQAGFLAKQRIAESLRGMLVLVPGDWPTDAKDPLDLGPQRLKEVLDNAIPMWAED